MSIICARSQTKRCWNLKLHANSAHDALNTIQYSHSRSLRIIVAGTGYTSKPLVHSTVTSSLAAVLSLLKIINNLMRCQIKQNLLRFRSSCNIWWCVSYICPNKAMHVHQVSDSCASTYPSSLDSCASTYPRSLSIPTHFNTELSPAND